MAKAAYSFTNTRNQPTPQSKPIPGREEEMAQNLAGGYGFKAGDFTALRRWLLTGSMRGAYYQGKEEMTEANVQTFKKVMHEDAARVAQEILDASKKGVSVHTPIYALTILSTGDKAAKNAFKEIFPLVIRNNSHLYEFFNYVKGMRGFGSIIHNSVKNWLLNQSAEDLEYQFLKYQNRYGWSGRDVLRMIKPAAKDNLKTALYNWVVGGTKKNPLYEIFPEELKKIKIYEFLKKGASSSNVVDAINKYKLTWEMIPGNIEMNKSIWEALFQNMPIGATIRNLGNLSNKGVFGDTKNVDILDERLSKENLQRAYIHPVNFASALMIYQGGGIFGKSKLTWTPVPRVMDIMEDGIDKTFDSVEPTGKHFYIALDVSSSMTCNAIANMWMTPLQVEGVMALATIKSEKNYFVGGFDTNFKVLSKFTKNANYSQVVNYRSGLWPDNFGGTDASVAYEYAIENKIKTDVFVFFTDNESWAGYSHPTESLKKYRDTINRNAKAVYVTIAAPYSDAITLVDPKDEKSYDIAGFTSQTPRLINLIAKDEV